MSNSANLKLNKVIKSSVALLLLVVLLVTISYSWMVANYTSQVTSNDFITIEASAGLEMNYGDKDNNIGTITFDSGKLRECSSVDGKNLFFPLSDYSPNGDGSFSNGVSTTDLVFREATANDKNTNYISVDFTLSADNDTDVWLDSSSYIRNVTAGNTSAKAVRIAFIDQYGNSKIFDNTTTAGYQEKNTAVKSISSDGIVTATEQCDVQVFDSYSFGNTEEKVLFHIPAGEEIRATMNIWLEGTDTDCTVDVLDENDIKVYIKFTTSYEELRTIYFKDYTLEKWLEDDECYVFAIDTDSKVHYRMAMSDTYDTDYTWSVSLPESVQNIQFVRYDPLNPSEDSAQWNEWPEETLGACDTYVAFGHSGGMWSKAFSGTTITVFDGTFKGWLRDQSAEFHVEYTVEDANGVTKNLNYKMSYINECNRYSIVIPSNVTNLSFHRMDSTQTTIYNSWTNLNRGTNLYYNITGSSGGFWGNRYIYIEDYANMKPGCNFVAYFYNDSKVGQWTGMHSKSNNGKNWYVAVVPADKSSGVVFTRYNPSETNYNAHGWSWDDVYNQSLSSLEYFGSRNLFKTTGYANENNKSCINGEWYTTTD